ncbi:NHL domain-containing protein [Micromonospora palythoicola]|uniref:NHL domain-containing protein n=1 Tax=Micromonospora palythoicola TaxID=3120507 RepID=UPI002FCE3DAC
MRTWRALVAALVVAATVAAPQQAAADGATATPYAGTGDGGYSGDGGPATAATLNKPGAVALGPGGVVYLADTENWVVRAISADGVITTVVGRGRAGQDAPQTPLNGDATVPAAEVMLRYPSSVAVGPTGTLYIGDGGNARILAMSRDGEVSLVAGGNGAGFSGDGGPAVEAQLRDVSGIEVEPDGALVFGDVRNYRVRRIAADGIIDTLVGSGDVGVLPSGEADSFTFPYGPLSTATVPGGDRWVASNLLYTLSDNLMRALVRDGNDRWSSVDPEDAAIPADVWRGTQYVTATGNAVYLSSEDGIYRLYPDGRFEILLANPSILGPLAMVDDRVGYLADSRQNRLYRLDLPALTDAEPGDDSGRWRLWSVLVVVVGLAVGLVVAVLVSRRRRP